MALSLALSVDVSSAVSACIVFATFSIILWYRRWHCLWLVLRAVSSVVSFCHVIGLVSSSIFDIAVGTVFGIACGIVFGIS